MSSAGKLRDALAAIHLTSGLPLEEVEVHLRMGVGLHDNGHLLLAFYLADMSIRGLHQEARFRSAVAYAEEVLGLERRRARELIAVGQRLLELPAILDAHRAQRIGWSKILHLVKVATPEHEQAWLEFALGHTCRELALEVRLTKPGYPPRGPGNRKGTREIRFGVKTTVSALTHKKLTSAQEKLAAERGGSVSQAELLDLLAELYLTTDADGNVPGRTRIDSSLYRIVVRSDETDPDGGDDAGLVVHTDDLGRVPIDRLEDDVRSASIRCDAQAVHVHDESGPVPTKDKQTPKALRNRVLGRDDHRCRCCGSAYQLHVHHIEFLSHGGKTLIVNLITLCEHCHALVHEGLLVLVGEEADHIAFADRRGRVLSDAGGHVDAALLFPLGEGPGLELPPAQPRTPPTEVHLEDVPERVDGAWWRRHAPLVSFRGGGTLEFTSGTPLPEASEVASATATPGPMRLLGAFEGVVGQGALVRRLEAAAKGSRVRARPFPHTLLMGPPGTGKTMIVERVARALDARLLRTSGPLLQGPNALVQLLADLRERDVLFVDEIHAVPRSVLETLYEAMAERQISLTIHAGPRVRTTCLELPPFTILAATTEGGELPDALWGRFGLRESLAYYATNDLAAVAVAAARREGVTLAEGGARRIAELARGTPREALRLVDRVLDRVDAGRSAVASTELAERVLEGLGYDALGLTPDDRRYLDVVGGSTDPVAVHRLARLMGMSVRTLTRHVEPHLVRRGLVRVTPQGRTAAPRLLRKLS